MADILRSNLQPEGPHNTAESDKRRINYTMNSAILIWGVGYLTPRLNSAGMIAPAVLQ